MTNVKHYTFGGSTCARTIACPAWVKRSEPIPKKGSSPYAVAGSMLHEVMEQCRLEGLKPQDILDRGFTYKDDEGHELEFTEDTLDLAEIAYNALEEHLDELDIDMFEIEPFVEIIPDEVGGSIDYLGLSEDGKTVLVADYKFGSGEVTARENKQLLFYALAAKTDPKTADFFEAAENVCLTIIQPKVKGVRKSWTAPVSVLGDFERTLLAAVDAAKSDNPKALAGSHCHWCPYEPYCKEKKAQIKAAMTLSTDNADSLADAMAIVDQVEDWAKEVKAEAHRMLEKGVPISGWKLVGKKAVNKWKDEDVAQEFLKQHVSEDKLYTTKTTFLTAPQAITLVKKLNKERDEPIVIDDLYDKIAPEGTTLAPADDPREEIKMGVNSENLKNLMKSA